MKKLALAISAIAVAATAAFAGPIEDREALMKERGQIVGGLSKVAKGETPFDAAAVATQLAALNANAEKGVAVEALWPVGSETPSTDDSPGPSPKIWEDMAGFKAAAEKYQTDVAAIVAAPPADVAGVQAAMGVIGKNCGGCHEAFRVSK